MSPHRARWYFDVISPYAYLYLKQFGRLDPALEVELVPVLFAGLLKHWGHKGPAELPTKRVHTYQQCVFMASKLGVPFRLPARHPFVPLKALRLLVALGAPRSAVERAFDFVWGEGRDPELEFPALGAALGVADASERAARPEVKQRLAANTERAIAEGVFGVPTIALDGHVFWGTDSIDWLNAFLADPGLFDRGEMKRAAEIEFGVARRT